jgi:urease accessory protein
VDPVGAVVPAGRGPLDLTGAGPRVGRDGALRLDVERRGARSVLARARFTLPLQVLAPVALDDPAAVVSILNPTGGLVGGDRLAIEAGVGPASHACFTTPSATKVYRTAGPPAVQDVTLRVEAGGVCEWIPDHTIPFAGSAFRQRIDVHVGDGACLILADAFTAGRVGRGEAWAFRLLDSAITVRDAKGWLLNDRFVLDDQRKLDPRGLGAAEGRPYFASLVVVADHVEGFRRAVAASLPRRGPLALAVGALPRRGAVVRCLAPSAPDLLDALAALWAAAREHVLGLPPLRLRKP